MSVPIKLYLIRVHDTDQHHKVYVNVLKHFAMTNNVREIAASFLQLIIIFSFGK